ncbi:uncharacterized protein TRUGW13939_05570 [Talaromyces rugulosus]|uniref:MoaB/Mog domain-containing protein n=1 Tax=Talaromyces rugulosus TaxID=121627 RepID=A0A7H8QXC2_TALRU|nr:uncharacterized protein TRUGW13939_05570 [Talaromyces rugulosus]QKX58446.1 hypothetical protein TRUGW13939_05570 [Talaromyces rugulosus]
MFGRFNQVARHLTRPLPNLAQTPAGLAASMTSSAKFFENKTKTIHTAACLIIGDEVLGGKTIDTNSAYFARWCFSLGIQLKRVEVIADDEDEIIEGVRRMSANYDFVVTSGGIGPTHDDITYHSIARAFGLPLKLYQPAFERMKKLTKPHPTQPDFNWDEPSSALTARLRMIELPYDENIDEDKQSVFVADDSWVPITTVNGNVHVLPGVPRLFEKLLDGLKEVVVVPRLADPAGNGSYRVLISTPLPESTVAGYLTDLALRVAPHGVKVGSYPRWGKKRNTVTLVGSDKDYIDSIVADVAQNVQGRRVATEDEDDPPSDTEAKQ